MPHAAKLDALQRRFQRKLQSGKPARGQPAKVKRVQKNLTIDERDAKRLKSLAATAKVSQAQLLSRALDAYERSQKETS